MATGIARAASTQSLDGMVEAYRALAGPLGEMTCWTAVRGVIERHPDQVSIGALERFIA
jgi:hypothetical protein